MTENKIKTAISGYYGFDNFGDEAILKVLTTELKKSGFEVTVFSKSPSKTERALDVNTANSFNLKEIFKTLKATDYLISGGGSLLQDVTSIKSLLYYLFIIYVALLLRKQVVIFAQGIGPIKNPICSFLTQIALKNCKYITVRDEKSKTILEGWGIKSTLVSDPVWNTKIAHSQKDIKRLGIQLRSWPTLTQRYIQKLAKCVAKEFPNHEFFIYSLQDTLDLVICENFAGYLKQELPGAKINVIEALSVDETIQAFADLDCMIAMRYHACLLALKYGIPTMALSYDTKVEKLANAFEIPCSFLNEKENLEQTVKKLKSIDTNRIIEEANDRKFDFSKFFNRIKS